MSGGSTQGWCSALYRRAGRESSGQTRGRRGFHSLHTRDSSLPLCCQTPVPEDQRVMPDLQETSGDCSGNIRNDTNGPCGTAVELEVSVFTLCWKAEGSFCFTKIKTQARARHCNFHRLFQEWSQQLKCKSSPGSAFTQLFINISHLHYFSSFKRGASSFLLKVNICLFFWLKFILTAFQPQELIKLWKDL